MPTSSARTAAYYQFGTPLPQGPIFHDPPSPDPTTPTSMHRVSRVRTEHDDRDAPAQPPHDPRAEVHFFPPHVVPGAFILHPAYMTNGAPIPIPAPRPDDRPYPGPAPHEAPPAAGAPPTHYPPPLPILYTQGPGFMAAASPVSSTSPTTSSSIPRSPTDPDANGHYSASMGVPRLPPILQVEKQQVTTSATQAASASRRRNEAHFVCPVPGCGSTFTRRFNLRGHLRSHTEERPYVCEWPGCGKGFARQHDCKRHQALHSQRTQSNVCLGCNKTFSRLDALNRHLRSEGGVECRRRHNAAVASGAAPTGAVGPARRAGRSPAAGGSPGSPSTPTPQAPPSPRSDGRGSGSPAGAAVRVKVPDVDVDLDMDADGADENENENGHDNENGVEGMDEDADSADEEEGARQGASILSAPVSSARGS